jgi:hypothetical protein
VGRCGGRGLSERGEAKARRPARLVGDEQSMNDIGNVNRVVLMQRLQAMKIEHRDLDVVVHELGRNPAHDQLQLTRLKRRKLLLKDQIAWLERQIDPDVSA